MTVQDFSTKPQAQAGALNAFGREERLKKVF